MKTKEAEHKSSQIISTGEKIFNASMIVIGIIITVLCLYPIYYVLIASFSKPYFVENGSVMFAAQGFSLQSYKEAFAKPNLLLSYGNSIFYTVTGVAINMIFTTTMAYALSKPRLKFRKALTLFAVFTMWFNAGIIPLYMTFRDYNLLDSRLSIIIGFAIDTYNLIIMKSFFEQVPASLEEAAFIDGANNITIFARVYLPLSKPALATIGLFYAVSRWNNYFWAMNLIQDDVKLPLQVMLKKLIVDRTANEMDAALITVNSATSPTTVIYAIIILAIIPMVIVYPFIQKYFKTGVTLGAVKG